MLPSCDDSSTRTSRFSSSMRTLRASKSSQKKNWEKWTIIGLSLGILYPLLFIACITLPTWWNSFTRDKIEAYEVHFYQIFNFV